MITINSFAFCFFSTNQLDIDIQNNEIDKLSDNFQIEKWFRKERNLSNYISFSQMVNDAIDDTDSEFMIFSNPKTIFNFKDIEFIIDKLSKGYCFVSKVSFGLFGFSKELIRNIGMLDERFINGGWEDNDFAIRLLNFGKSTWWEYKTTSYKNIISESGNLKHISTSIFNQKYNIDKNKKIIQINEDLFVHKQISGRHKQNNKQIFDSWLDSTHNYGDGIFGEYLTQYSISYDKVKKTYKQCDFYLEIMKQNDDVMITLLSDENFSINLSILKSFEYGRTILWDLKIPANTFKTLKVHELLVSKDYFGPIEIRLFIDNNQFYNNTLGDYENLKLNFSLPIQLDQKTL